MNATRAMQRAVTMGVTVTALLVGSAVVQPVGTAAATVLPHADVGAPDTGYPGGGGCGTACRNQALPPSPGEIGYPCAGGCFVQSRPRSSGDVGHPSGGCTGGCPTRLVSPAPSGDIGYPSGGCAGGCGIDVETPPTAGDVGYPCPTCGTVVQAETPQQYFAAWN